MVITKQEEKVYAAALKLRGIDEVLEKLNESGTLDILSECISSIKKTEPESKSQLKVLASLIIDEIWESKSRKQSERGKKSESLQEDPYRSYTARSTQMLTSARSCEFSKMPLSTRKASTDLVSEFNQTRGGSFGKAPRDPISYKCAPGPGTYNPNSYNKEKIPSAVFGRSARPDHFVKPVCQELYNPLYYFSSRPQSKNN